MSSIENYKSMTYDPFKTKTIKRKNSVKMAPNISLNLISVSVLPPNSSWSDMEDFVAWKYGPFSFNFKNTHDKIIAGINFYVSYNCRGQFNSMGQYLADATISPVDVFADPEYYFTCNVTAGDPLNYGTKADPIAGVVLKVQMQAMSYHKLKSTQYYSLENLITPKVLPNTDEPEKEINLITANDISKAVDSKSISASAYSYDKENNTAASKMLRRSASRFNMQEQYLNVIVRGDCQVNLICAYGY